MSRTKIEWVRGPGGERGVTWNPVTGCSPVSPGCDHCYAARMAKRLQAMGNPNYADGFAVTYHHHMVERPMRWRKPRHVFVCSMSDLFHDDVADDDLDAIFGVMWACRYLGRGPFPGHTFQLLTKRPERMRAYLEQDRRRDWADWAVNFGGGIEPDLLWDSVVFAGGPHPRIWLGVTGENGLEAHRRLVALRDISAAVHFVSVEPMLTPVDLGPHLHWLDWVICGCESGPGARPMRLSWAAHLRDQCKLAGVPFFLKQARNENGTGKLVKMPKLDGRVWDEVPGVEVPDAT